MSKDSAAADPTPKEAPQSAHRFSGLLATRTRKIAAAVGAAILASIGGGIATWMLTAAESTTKRVFGGPVGQPIVVRVEPDGTFFTGHPFAPYYVIPKSRFPAGPNGIGKDELVRMQKTEEGMDTAIAFAWARAHGAVAGTPQVVRLELRGTTDEPVTVTAIRPIIVARSAPLRGWYVAAPGCGAVPVRVADINLDGPQAPVIYTNPRVPIGTPAAKRVLALSVTRTDLEQIELHASTSNAVAWKAKIFYSAPNGTGSMVIDDAGKPFRVTAVTKSDGYRSYGTYHGSNNHWVPQGFRRDHSWDGKGISAC